MQAGGACASGNTAGGCLGGCLAVDRVQRETGWSAWSGTPACANLPAVGCQRIVKRGWSLQQMDVLKRIFSGAGT